MRIYGFTRYGGPEAMGFLSADRLSGGSDRVLVRLHAASLNPADIKVRNGERVGKVPVEFPMAMGREAAGVVLEDAGPFAAGDLVFGSCAAGSGALAEVVALDLAGTAAVPEGVSVEQAACLPVAAGTAWDAMHELGVGEGTTVLVLGAGGGVGSHACQLVRHLGGRAIGLASESKRELVTGLGAEHVASGPGWVERVLERAPDGVDAIVDSVGDEVLKDAFALVADPARVRSSASPALASQLGGSGVTRRREASVYAQLAHLVATGRLSPVISQVFAFEDADRAWPLVEGGHATGKVVVLGPEE